MSTINGLSDEVSEMYYLCAEAKRPAETVPLYWIDGINRSISFFQTHREMPILLCWFDDGGYCGWSKSKRGTWNIVFSKVLGDIGNTAVGDFAKKLDEAAFEIVLRYAIETVILEEDT